MDFKDYYKILGVTKSSTIDEIKKTYRKLAIKYHPDKNLNDKSAEEKFKEINEANNVLGDPVKRKKYDELADNWKHEQQTGQQWQGFNSSQQKNKSGENYNANNSREQFTENEFSDFFENIFGGSFKRGQQNQQKPLKGEDYQAEIQMSLEESYSGTARQLDLDKQKLQLKIKPGVKDGQILRLKGKGGKGVNGAPDGDILLTVHIPNHPHYKRQADDLYCDIIVDLYTAILGGQTFIKTLRSPIKINITKGTENGKVVRLKGMGMPKYAIENEFGDLYAKVIIKLPTNLSLKETELFNELLTIKNTSDDKAV